MHLDAALLAYLPPARVPRRLPIRLHDATGYGPARLVRRPQDQQPARLVKNQRPGRHRYRWQHWCRGKPGIDHAVIIPRPVTRAPPRWPLAARGAAWQTGRDMAEDLARQVIEEAARLGVALDEAALREALADADVRDYIGQRDAGGLLAEFGLLPAGQANAGGLAGQPDADRFLGALREHAGEGWQAGIRRGGPGPDLLLRRPDASSPEVAVYLDEYERHAVPPCNRLAADAAERARLRAAGTVVFQVTADEARALVEGDPSSSDLGGAPYEDEAQAAARRGYRILGGDPAELDDLIWAGSARMLLAFLSDPGGGPDVIAERWRWAATAALSGLLVRPGGVRSRLTDRNFPELVQASVYGDPVPPSGGRERTLVRAQDRRGCPVTVIIDQRHSGPARPLGSWAGLVVIDDRPHAIRSSGAAHPRRWVSWLYWGNLLQFLGDGRQLAHRGLSGFDPLTLAVRT
jgi:hypothetical protein